jgi:hypothetical protein
VLALKNDLQPERAGNRFNLSERGRRIRGVGWIDQHRNPNSRGCKKKQETAIAVNAG